MLDPQDMEYMRLAIDFYSKLNDLSDDELEACDFSREEIDDGLQVVINIFCELLNPHFLIRLLPT